MIVKALIGMLSGLIEWITAGLNIPGLPPEVAQVAAQVTQYLVTGLQIVANFTHLDYLLVLFGVVIAVDAGMLVYKFIMWIIKKIPMLGMS